MDLAFWGFSAWPFPRHAKADGINVGDAHEEALARMLFLVDERRRGGLLTGIAETGKSRLFRRVGSYARRHGRFVIEIDAGLGADELAWQIAERLTDAGPETRNQWTSIQRQFAARALIRQPVVLLLDQIDLMDSHALPTIRRVMNLAGGSEADVTVLAAARSCPADRDIDEFELVMELSGWSIEETSQFVTESLRAVHSRARIFSADAITAIHQWTAGVPGKVIRICDLALLAASSESRRDIDTETIEACALELRWHTKLQVRSTPPQRSLVSY